MIPSKKLPRVLTVFVLAMLNVSIMLSLRTLPIVAQLGLSSIFFFAIVAVFFLLPCALVSAELGTGWPKSGGIYIWVREALGDRFGFFSIWMQWVHNVAWYPVILSFTAMTIAYIVNPALAENKFFVLTIILASFWGMTLLNYTGIKISSRVSTIGVISGTILPGLFIIGLGAFWFFSGRPTALNLDTQTFLPDFTSSANLVFLSGLFLAFAGLEVSSSLAGEIKNPQKNYPRAIALSALIVFFILILGALAISCVLPTSEISLIAGLMESLEKFLPSFGLQHLLPILGVFIIIGALAEVNSWIIAPAKGLHITSMHGNLPPIFQRLNSHGTPTNILLLQAIIVSFVSLVFLFMPNISSGFWILTVLSAQSYLIMYIAMFISAIKLRYSKPNVHRTYKIPFSNVGMWAVACMGILASSFTIIIGFSPPTNMDTGNPVFYKLFLLGGLAFMCGIPLIIHQCKKPSWNYTLEKGHQERHEELE